MAVKRIIWANEMDPDGLHLEDEQMNLDIETKNPILVIADLGLWYGRRTGYKVLGTQNVNNIFGVTCGDCVTFYADQYNVHCEDIHHDGTNCYLFRELVGSADECEPLLDALYSGTDEGKLKKLIRRYSRSILPQVADIYGWPVAGHRRKKVA